MNRRAILSVVVTALAGCAALDGDDAQGWDEKPAYDDVVLVTNRANESVDVELEIVHERTGDTVHREQYSVDAGSSRETYDFRATQNGVEHYRIVARLSNGEETSAGFSTHACDRDPEVIVQEDRTLRSTSSVC